MRNQIDVKDHEGKEDDEDKDDEDDDEPRPPIIGAATGVQKHIERITIDTKAGGG
jgi:hypothetical protein